MSHAAPAVLAPAVPAAGIEIETFTTKDVRRGLRPPRLINIKVVRRRTTLSKSVIFTMIQAGLFPPPVPITKFRVGWVEAEIDDWIHERIAARDRGERAPKPSARPRRTA